MAPSQEGRYVRNVPSLPTRHSAEPSHDWRFDKFSKDKEIPTELVTYGVKPFIFRLRQLRTASKNYKLFGCTTLLLA